MNWRVGVDTGGTFTDLCVYNEQDRSVTVLKISSTPSDPGEAIVRGLEQSIIASRAAEDGDDAELLAQVSYFAHGTTVATNALLEGRGAKTALITTEGFRDLLEIARQKRPKLYDINAQKPAPLIARDLRLEVSERVRHTGEVERELQDEDLDRIVKELRGSDVEAIAVLLLYSYIAPEHEERIKARLGKAFPEAFLSISHEVLPEFREYERLSTTVINAFVGPVMRGYIRRLGERLAEFGLSGEPKLTQSNGGVMSFEAAGEFPVRTVLSGPSTGVVGAAHIASESGQPDIITFDMGGTSTDVALVNDAKPVSAKGMDLDGRPVMAPMLDINTVGAGGGSIAWVDEGGHLKVGPRSAGAFPGPACYGQGTSEPTVTDANVVLGILNQEYLLDGTMPIDAELSFRAVETLGAKLGLSAIETAKGILEVVTANMARAIRVVSVQRGYDPKDYALVAFGGAGPLHSGRLARELGITRSLIPGNPGAMSALGMLMTDLRADHSRTVLSRLDEHSLDALQQVWDGIEQATSGWFEREGVREDEASFGTVLDLRYVGQNYELSVDSPGGRIDGAWLEAVVERFEEQHRLRYGFINRDEPIEIVTMRIEAKGAVPKADSPRGVASGRPVADAIVAHRDIALGDDDERISSPVYRRDLLEPGHTFSGPCIVEQYDTTTAILPGQFVTVDDTLVMHVTESEKQQ